MDWAGLQVSRLIRIQYGPISLGQIPPGKVAKVPDKLLQALMTDFQQTAGT